MNYSNDTSKGQFTFTDAAGNSTTYAVDSLGRITGVQDGLSRTVVTNVYDEWDRVLNQKTFGDAGHTWTFGLAPGVAAQTDPAMHVDWTYFDFRNREICTVDGTGKSVTTWRYDGARPAMRWTPIAP